MGIASCVHMNTERCWHVSVCFSPTAHTPITSMLVSPIVLYIILYICAQEHHFSQKCHFQQFQTRQAIIMFIHTILQTSGGGKGKKPNQTNSEVTPAFKPVKSAQILLLKFASLCFHWFLFSLISALLHSRNLHSPKQHLPQLNNMSHTVRL